MVKDICFSNPLTLGQKVRISRIALSLTQQELSVLTHTTQAQISSVERNHFVHHAVKNRILDYLHLSGKEDPN
jgi:hypothetical protein